MIKQSTFHFADEEEQNNTFEDERGHGTLGLEEGALIGNILKDDEEDDKTLVWKPNN